MTAVAIARVRGDRAPDAPQLVELIGTINHHARVPWFPNLAIRRWSFYRKPF